MVVSIYVDSDKWFECIYLFYYFFLQLSVIGKLYHGRLKECSNLVTSHVNIVGQLDVVFLEYLLSNALMAATFNI